jgi:uncharacterized protein YecE (DUF72 family)
MPPRPPAEIRVGPAGWSYEDWQGIVYPQQRPRDFHEASYLARYFDTVEINTTFYNPPRPEVTRSWVRRVQQNPRFKFTAKLWQRFTHDRDAGLEDEKTFKKAIEPLAAAGKLGALLMQFPWSFKNMQSNREFLGGLVVEFMEYPLVVEVRHESWNRPEIFQMLRELGVGFCNIDQPVIGKSIAPSERATAPVGYVRLHGRNYDQWFASREQPAERYNYLYSMAELEPWAERIRSVAARADTVFVITNNHFRGKAVANGFQLIHLLTQQPVRIPQSLIEHYPELESIALPDVASAEPQQASLSFETVGKKSV